MKIVEKRSYFKKKGKTPEEKAEHHHNQTEKHKLRMKNYYRVKKIERNNLLKDKFNEVYEFLSSEGGRVNITDIEEKVTEYTETRFKCLCFDKLYLAYQKALDTEE